MSRNSYFRRSTHRFIKINMQNLSILSTRLYLSLSLAIASCLIANVVKAESQAVDRASVAALSQQIATILDLDLDRQIFLRSALQRAIAAKETTPSAPADIAGGKTLQPRPIIRGKIVKPQPNPSPKPKEKIGQQRL